MAQDIQENPPETEGEHQVVEGLAQAELTGRIKNSSEVYNMAQDLDEELLTELGKEVFEGFKIDCESRSEWLMIHAFWLSLYMQQDYAETQDEERDWGATESVPILTESCDQFQARTFKIFFPNDTFVSAVPMQRTVEAREILEARADRIGKHMSYQLGYQDRNYKLDKNALFLGVAVHGSFFTKTYFDQQKRRFKVDNVRPTDLVINYSVGPVRIEDVRRKTHIIYTTVGETEDLAAQDYLLEPAKEGSITIDEKYNTKVDQSQGIASPDGGRLKREAPAVLLEQHNYFDIGDGNYHPYIATICAVSQKILRFTIGYEADEKGKPLNNYEQIQYFTHYKFKENPDGFYGLGLGHAIGDLNSGVNIMLRQSIDAATLANDGNMSGFISERLGLEGDEIRLTLGKFNKIPDSVGDLQQSVMMMKFPGPNVAQIQLMEAMDERAQRMGSVTEAVTGGSDKVEQPTTYLAKIEQSLEQFSSTQLLLAHSLTDELNKIYRINQRFLPFHTYFTVNGVPETITRDDYKSDMLIQPIFDPKYATQGQKVARAQAELNATLQNPVNEGRPQVIDEAFRRYMKALDVEDIDALIPPQPQIENFDDQILENMWFLMPKEARPLFDVFPDQNHAIHLAILNQFLAQYSQVLQPDQQEDVLKHMQKHQGYLYGQENGLLPPSQAGQQPTPPLAARQDNAMGAGTTTPDLSQAESELLGEIMGGAAPDSGAAAGSGAPSQVA